MYLRKTTQRRADGRKISHLQFADNTWNREKKRSEVRVVYTWGREDDEEVAAKLKRLAHSILKRMAPEDLQGNLGDWKVADAVPYGDLYVLECLWERLGIGKAIEKRVDRRRYRFPVERALFTMVANRAMAPRSRASSWEQWLREDVRIEGTRDLGLHHLYLAMDVLMANQEAIEREIFSNVLAMFELNADVLFYDAKPMRFEAHSEDPGPEGDASQIIVGLAVTRDGFPVRHWVFPGDVVDMTMVDHVRQDLQEWSSSGCVFVGDSSLVSEDRLETLRRGGGRYIVSMPVSSDDEAGTEAMARAGRYKEIVHDLRVKEVVVGADDDQKRYVVCYSPEEARRQQQLREQVLAELRAELGTLQYLDPEQRARRENSQRKSRRYGQYLRFSHAGRLEIDRGRVRSAERLDGKLVLRCDDETLTPEDVALGYRQLQRVEEAWRTLESGLRPVFQRAPHRVHAHAGITLLSLLLERVAEYACEDTWGNIRDDLRQIKIAHLSGPEGETWQVTEPSPDAEKRLKSLGLQSPPPVLGDP